MKVGLERGKRVNWILYRNFLFLYYYSLKLEWFWSGLIHLTFVQSRSKVVMWPLEVSVTFRSAEVGCVWVCVMLISSNTIHTIFPTGSNSATSDDHSGDERKDSISLPAQLSGMISEIVLPLIIENGWCLCWCQLPLHSSRVMCTLTYSPLRTDSWSFTTLTRITQILKLLQNLLNLWGSRNENQFNVHVSVQHVPF